MAVVTRFGWAAHGFGTAAQANGADLANAPICHGPDR